MSNEGHPVTVDTVVDELRKILDQSLAEGLS